jgi:hypothetical protein
MHVSAPVSDSNVQESSVCATFDTPFSCAKLAQSVRRSPPFPKIINLQREVTLTAGASSSLKNIACFGVWLCFWFVLAPGLIDILLLKSFVKTTSIRTEMLNILASRAPILLFAGGNFSI